MRRRATLVVALLGGVPALARAADPPPVDLTDRHAAETKAVLPLLRTAEKERFARQAWYLAWRISLADPTNSEAVKFFEAHEPESFAADDLLPPSKPFAVARDKALAAEGDAYARLARELQAKGVRPADVFALTERALAYGSKAGDLLGSVADAGWAWAGTFGTQKAEAFEQALGPIRGIIAFPPEWDDAFLAVRPRWRDAKIVALGGYRLVTEEGFVAAARRATLLVALDAEITALLGGPPRARREDPVPVDFVVVPDAALFDALGKRWLARDAKDAADRFARASGWEMHWAHRVAILAKDRFNAWAGDDAPFLFHAARTLASLRLGSGSGRMTGRGSWILDGVGGCFEAFVAKGATGGDLDPARCWRLHVAKALRARKQLLAWDALEEVDLAAQDARARAEVSVRFRGADRSALAVDVVAAQATALVWGLLHADGGREARKVGAILSETVARDRLPDLDKAMGWPKGRAFKEAEKALDELPPSD